MAGIFQTIVFFWVLTSCMVIFWFVCFRGMSEQAHLQPYDSYHLISEQHVKLTFRHRASCILGQVFHYSPENALYIFNQQIYFII
jgi:hypothetical protein